MNGALKTILLAGLALSLWAFAHYHQPKPPLLGANAPPGLFSEARARAMEARILGPQIPHPNSTDANAAVRARLLGELARLGIAAHPYRATGCFTEKRFAVAGCATVTDVIANVLPGAGPAIVMVAHYDSVPAGPGAGDDGSGVATLLETARALRAVPGKPGHPVIALFTDGEEYGMLGAAAFAANPVFRAETGVAINMEARGNRGPSRLFQLSPKPSKLISLYAASAPVYAASSLYAEIYRFLPNDTDLTVFLRAGIDGYNFAITDRLPHYHTPRDRLENLSPISLQDHGDNLLGLVRALEPANFARLKGHGEVYLDLFGRLLPRIDAAFALPAALLGLLLAALGGIALARGASARDWLAGLLIVPGMILGAGLAGFVLVFMAQTVSGMPEPGYAHPFWLRLTLTLGVAGVTLLAARLAPARAAAAGVWVWFALFAVLTALYLPGISPYFLLPLAFAAALLPLAAFFGKDSPLAGLALFGAGLAALVVWIQLTEQSETVMGLKLHPLFTVPAAIGLSSIIPLLARNPLGYRVALGCFAMAAIAAVIAGFQPAYSIAAPQRLNLTYIADGRSGEAHWAADANAPVPAALAKVAVFSKTAQQPYPGAWLSAYLASAPKLALAMPGATITGNARTKDGRRLTLRLDGAGDMMTVALPGSAGLTRVLTGDAAFAVPREWAQRKLAAIGCLSRDCAHATITLEMADRGPLSLTLLSRTNGLPPQGAALTAARPDWAVQSGYGDGTMLSSTLAIPAAR